MRSREKENREKKKKKEGTDGDGRGTDERSGYLYRGRAPPGTNVIICTGGIPCTNVCMVCTGWIPDTEGYQPVQMSVFPVVIEQAKNMYEASSLCL
jgi:hypothetical protein